MSPIDIQLDRDTPPLVHGSIGLGRRDSLVATLIFMAAGMATVALVKLLPWVSAASIPSSPAS